MVIDGMRNEFDFSRSQKNPNANELNPRIILRVDAEALNYFKGLASELRMPYRNLINLYLRDCAVEKRRPVIQWPQHPIRRMIQK